MASAQKPKRRHHHVWRKYLRAWTIEDAIWCRQGNRVFRTNTPAVAVEKDFYKLQRLTTHDVELLKHLIPQHHLFGRDYDVLLRVLMTDFISTSAPDNNKAMTEWAFTAIENHHSRIETSFIPSLNETLKGDISFYDDTEMALPFLHYLAAQWMRTKGAKERAIGRCETYDNVDLSRIWNLLIPHLALVAGINLFKSRKRRRLVLVRNNHATRPLITSDQPVINLKATLDRPVGDDELTAYYPISASLALLLLDLDADSPFPAGTLTPAQVSALNNKMFESCHRQAFGLTERSLNTLRESYP